MPQLRLFFFLALMFAAVQAPAAQPGGLVLIGPSGTRQLSAEDVAALPRAKVTISDHGAEATFEGPTLAALLALVGAPAGDKIRGEELLKYALVEAADSYRAAFTLAELDATFTDHLVILADTRDGKRLSAKEGPLRLIVQGDKRQSRCVRQVTRITMGTISSGSTGSVNRV